MTDGDAQKIDAPQIVVVDDNPAGLRLLADILTNHGYKVRPTLSGSLALRSVTALAPDLILLDVKMPEMDGYEVCRLLKADERSRGIPVIFVSALDEATDKVQGFLAGGVDYINRPFEPKEILARVETHLALRRLQVQMGELVAQRTAELEKSNDALRESEERFRNLVETTSDWIWEVDTNAVYTYVSPKIQDVLGYAPEEILGKTVFDLMPPEEANSISGYFNTIFASQEMFSALENISLHKDNYLVVLETGGVPFFDRKGKFRGYRCISRNITERKRAEEDRVRLSTAIEQSAEAVFITGTDWVIQYVNSAFERITGHERSAIVGQHARILRNDSIDKTLYKQMGATLSRGEVWSGRLLSKRKDGTSFEVEATTSPVRDKSGSIINYVSIYRDVTNEVRLERQLRQAQKMEAIGTLAGGIAHDFNNILTAIMGYAQLAHFKAPVASPVRSSLEQLLKAGHRASDLVGQILTFSRPAEQKRKPVEIAIIVKEAIKFLRSILPSTIEIRQEISIRPEKGMVLADPTQIHQVLMNLCANSAHAMRDKGGILNVGLSGAVVDSSVAFGTPDLMPGPYVMLTVSDTGFGMTPEVMERAFDPYFTTKEPGEGTGLGLSVVQGIVKSQGGAITVHSEPGQGATFHVFLPGIEGEIAPEIDEVEILAGGTERILFIDDEEILADLGKELLEPLGYQVTASTNSLEALQTFRAHPDRFDLVITDMTMPGLTGVELAKELTAIRPDIPVILCTGLAELANGKSVQDAGIRRFIMKPYEIGNLSQVVRKVLDA